MIDLPLAEFASSSASALKKLNKTSIHISDYEDIKTEIFEQLKNPEYAWKLSFVYTIGNNFNVCVDKTTFIELSCLIPSENELDTKFSLDVSEPFTKLEKGVYIRKQ